MRPSRRRALAVLSALVLTCVPAPSAPAAATAAARANATAGSSGAGDPYFPLQGNGGYDVRHYAIDIVYQPHRDQHLSGVVRITAVATQALSRFDLDLRPAMTAQAVLVNGVPAAHRQPAAGHHELVITPRHDLAAGRVFRVKVTYSGTGKAFYDPDGSPDGWIPTGDGAFVANEPQGSPSWFPVNDTPTDKARYSVTMNVPKGLTAISNGRLLGHTSQGTRSIWRWNMTRPISSYLVTATVGRFDLHRGRTANGIPWIVAVDPSQRGGQRTVLTKLSPIVTFFASRYGRYPFPQTGAIVDNAPNVGYALETATRPLFPGAPDELTLAHELAHQWYGDTVTCKRWRDIWINEGFAEFSTWMWDQHSGGTTMRQHLRRLLALPAGNAVWNPPPGNPGRAADIFADSVYERGAGVLEALREKVGAPVFFRIMRGWIAKHRYGNATAAGFATYAAAVAHRDLSHFFYVWLFRPGKPS